jgi:hypothetical protein
VIPETRAHVLLLWSLTALFAFRVAAQLVQYTSPTPLLPSFEAWQGSGLGYPVLLASQLVILVLMISGVNRIARGTPPVRRVGVWLLALGGVYFAVMAVRLALFHLVLAGYLLTLGHYHLRGGARTASA